MTTKPHTTSIIPVLKQGNRLRPTQMICWKGQSLQHPLLNQLINVRPNSTDNYCTYLHRHCQQNRIDSYNFCLRHILQDRNAPYKQCSYIHPQTNKRCPNAARRFDRRDRENIYCLFHIKKFNLLKRKAFYSEMDVCNETRTNLNMKRKFEELEHYCPSKDHDHRRKNINWELTDDDVKYHTSTKALKLKINESIKNIKKEDYSDLKIGDTLEHIDINLDDECTETYMDDALRHAGVYSAEEIARILRDKMLRLQALFINVLTHYRYILKIKMRKYYKMKLKEKSKETKNSSESMVNLGNDLLKETEEYKLLNAKFKYHNSFGIEKIIQNKASNIRQSLVEEDESKVSSFATCYYKVNNEVCHQKNIPLSNYCSKHILYDPYQKLYRPCARDIPECLIPVVSYIHKNTCTNHSYLRYDKSDLAKMSPDKLEIDNEPINDLETESELFDIGLEMDSVEPNNLFNIQFDLDSNIL